MNSLLKIEHPIPKFKAVMLWRFIYCILPFGFSVHRVFAMFRPDGALVRIPWGIHYLVLLSEWLDRPTSAPSPVYRGPWIQNPEFFEILRPQLSSISDGLIADIGANIGAYCLNIRACCSNPIIAFEPDPETFQVLQLSILESKIENIILENVACGNVKGTLDFLQGTNGSVSPNLIPGMGAGGKSSVKVPVIIPDERFRSEVKVSMMKIDCEGYEVEILKGSLDILRNQRPLLFIEVHPNMLKDFDGSPEQICDILEPIYDLQFWKLSDLGHSHSRLVRFFNRYRRGVKRLRDKIEFLNLANGSNPPDQIFLLAIAKSRIS
jgi:FkbM family methyltransferase